MTKTKAIMKNKSNRFKRSIYPKIDIDPKMLNVRSNLESNF